MKVLVLDTIHGGLEIGAYIRRMGHFVDVVDVYRGRSGIDAETAAMRDYDLMIAPIHLDPACPILHASPAPRITHHAATRWILGRTLPSPMIEITGARGKTTTACALAHVMQGCGILHCSTGTLRYPARIPLWKKSITPASVIPAAAEAKKMGGWLISEESLGFSGAGTLGIISSGDDYPFAGGKRSALQEKLRSGLSMSKLLVPPGINPSPGGIVADTICHIDGCSLSFEYGTLKGSFENPLLETEGYRLALMLASAAACIMGTDPSSLSGFAPVAGRLSSRWQGDILIVDDSNSGTSYMTTVQAVDYARARSKSEKITLVIGQEGRSVCEGYQEEDILEAIHATSPDQIVIVGEAPGRTESLPDTGKGVRGHRCQSLDEGLALALSITGSGSIVLAVKTWR